MKLFNKRLTVTLIFLQILAFSRTEAYSQSNTPKSQVDQYLIAASEPQKIIAVADFTNDTGENSMDYLKKGLANSLVTSLGINPKSNFSLVERGQLESLIKEMGLTETGLVDVNNATKIGNALGATQIIVGGLIKLGNTLRINVRVIDVRTSRLMLAFSEYADSEGDVLKRLDKVADKIAVSLSASKDNIPAANIRNLKIEDAAQPAVPVWLWIAGGVVIAAAAIVIGILATRSQTKIIRPVITKP